MAVGAAPGDGVRRVEGRVPLCVVDGATFSWEDWEDAPGPGCWFCSPIFDGMGGRELKNHQPPPTITSSNGSRYRREVRIHSALE